MRWPFSWPFRLPHRPDDDVGPASPDSAAREPVSAVAAPRPAWQDLPPIERTIGAPRPIARARAFGAGLAARQGREPMLRSLGHDVRPGAPSGLVSNLVTPLARRSSGAAVVPSAGTGEFVRPRDGRPLARRRAAVGPRRVAAASVGMAPVEPAQSEGAAEGRIELPAPRPLAVVGEGAAEPAHAFTEVTWPGTGEARAGAPPGRVAVGGSGASSAAAAPLPVLPDGIVAAASATPEVEAPMAAGGGRTGEARTDLPATVVQARPTLGQSRRLGLGAPLPARPAGAIDPSRSGAPLPSPAAGSAIEPPGAMGGGPAGGEPTGLAPIDAGRPGESVPKATREEQFPITGGGERALPSLSIVTRSATGRAGRSRFEEDAGLGVTTADERPWTTGERVGPAAGLAPAAGPEVAGVGAPGVQPATAGDRAATGVDVIPAALGARIRDHEPFVAPLVPARAIGLARVRGRATIPPATPVAPTLADGILVGEPPGPPAAPIALPVALPGARPARASTAPRVAGIQRAARTRTDAGVVVPPSILVPPRARPDETSAPVHGLGHMSPELPGGLTTVVTAQRTAVPASPAVPAVQRAVAVEGTSAATASDLLTDDRQLDLLARRLYDGLRVRLETELLLDRERAGLLADLRS